MGVPEPHRSGRDPQGARRDRCAAAAPAAVPESVRLLAAALARPVTEAVSRIVVRPFLPDAAAAVSTAIVDSSIHHVGLEPARYQVLDSDEVAAMYRAGRQHPPDSKPDER